MNQLCPEDRAILNSLFNPLLPLGEGVYTDDEPQASEYMLNIYQLYNTIS